MSLFPQYIYFLFLQFLPHALQFPPQLLSPRCFHIKSTATATAKIIKIISSIDGKFIYITPINIPTKLTSNAAIHAMTHCPITSATAHFVPSSLLIEATAATHGV